jgi:hypothetical protein
MALIPFNKITVVLLAFLTYGLSACVTAPPVQEMSDARQAIQAAEAVGASTKASVPFSQAQENIEEAESALQSGDYSKAREQALRAKSSALKARSRALEGTNR